MAFKGSHSSYNGATEITWELNSTQIIIINESLYPGGFNVTFRQCRTDLKNQRQ